MTPRPHDLPAGKPTVRCVIFDLDGVLVWSVPMHWRAYQKTFAAEGRELSLEEYMRVGTGASREEVIRRILGDLPESKIQFLMAEKERHVREYLRDQDLETIPGSLDFVRQVRARDAKTAVATASRNPEMVLRAVGALELFDAIIGRGMVKRSKPHPDLYLRAGEEMGTPPAECLVIEDSPVGIEAAHTAGMRVLALTTTEEASCLSRADAVFKSFAEIPIEEWIPR